MTEAGLAVVKYGFEELGLEKIYGRYFVSNPASGRVLQKIGMTYEGHLRKHVRKGGVSRDLMMYSIIKSEFEKISL
jgi:RimJ/RimL family protein N-acetyltransferase